MGDSNHKPHPPTVTFTGATTAPRRWRLDAGGQPEPDVLFTLDEETDQERGQEREQEQEQETALEDGTASNAGESCDWLRDRLSRFYIRCDARLLRLTAGVG